MLSASKIAFMPAFALHSATPRPSDECERQLAVALGRRCARLLADELIERARRHDVGEQATGALPIVLGRRRTGHTIDTQAVIAGNSREQPVEHDAAPRSAAAGPPESAHRCARECPSSRATELRAGVARSRGRAPARARARCSASGSCAGADGIERDRLRRGFAAARTHSSSQTCQPRSPTPGERGKNRSELELRWGRAHGECRYLH